MGNTQKTGYLQNLIQYDGSGNIVLPGTLTISTNKLVATQEYVGTQVAALVNSAPTTLDTLNELAAALGNDPNFATTVATSIGTKQAQLNGTGFVKVSGTTVSYDNSTYLTTASATSTYLPLSGGTLTGALSGTSATFSGAIQGNGLTLLNSSGTYANWYVSSYLIGRIGNVDTNDMYYDSTFGGNHIFRTGTLGTTSPSNKMIITSYGNVGIGTTSPSEKLVVKVATNQNLEIRQASSLGAYNGIGLDALNDARNTVVDLVLRGTNLSLISSGATPMILATNSTERMRITSGGNVGIGTQNPTSISTYTTLEIRGATGGGVKIGKTGFSQFNIQQDGTDAYFNNVANGAMYFYTNDAERIKITSGGNVEINTGSIKTGEPDTGYGRAAFKIGTRQSGTATDSGGYIPISIDGTVYFINLYTSTP